MSVLKPLDEMTPEDLQCRSDFHFSTAVMFRQHGEFTEARKFQDLSEVYAKELARRNGAEFLPIGSRITQADIDRTREARKANEQVHPHLLTDRPGMDGWDDPDR